MGGIFYMYNSSNVDPNMPADFKIIYSWQAGSMPPPAHFEYSIELNAGGEGAITYFPDYEGAGTPKWVEQFIAQKTDVEALYKLMREKKAFTRTWELQKKRIIGGDYAYLKAFAFGKESKIPSHLEDPKDADAIYEFIGPLVPQNIWEKLSKQRKKYEEGYNKKNKG